MTEQTLTVGGATVTVGAAAGLSETPSEQMIRSASGPVDVKDARGRTIKLQKPKVLDQFRLVECLGNAAQNQTYMGMVIPLLFVTAIDGDVVVRPGSKVELEALIQRLDDEGVQAVMEGVASHFAAPNEDDAKNA